MCRKSSHSCCDGHRGGIRGARAEDSRDAGAGEEESAWRLGRTARGAMQGLPRSGGLLGLLCRPKGGPPRDRSNGPCTRALRSTTPPADEDGGLSSGGARDAAFIDRRCRGPDGLDGGPHHLSSVSIHPEVERCRSPLDGQRDQSAGWLDPYELPGQPPRRGAVGFTTLVLRVAWDGGTAGDPLAIHLEDHLVVPPRAEARFEIQLSCFLTKDGVNCAIRLPAPGNER